MKHNIAITAPLPVSDVRVMEVNATSIQFTWTPNPGSVQDSYQLALSGNHGNPVVVMAPRARVDGLVPSTNYTVSVLAVSAGRTSLPSMPFTTNTGRSSWLVTKLLYVQYMQ